MGCHPASVWASSLSCTYPDSRQQRHARHPESAQWYVTNRAPALQAPSHSPFAQPICIIKDFNRNEPHALDEDFTYKRPCGFVFEGRGYADEKPPRPDLPQREKLEAASRRFAVKYLLGVMNSSAARDFLRANRRSNIHLYPDDWKKLPIPDIALAEQQPLVALVDRILAAKTAHPGADISPLESEIDRLVSALYGLPALENAIMKDGIS